MNLTTVPLDAVMFAGLKANGASLVDVAEATHIISNTLQFEGNERATNSVNIVTVRHRYFVSSKKALT